MAEGIDQAARIAALEARIAALEADMSTQKLLAEENRKVIKRAVSTTVMLTLKAASGMGSLTVEKKMKLFDEVETLYTDLLKLLETYQPEKDGSDNEQ